MLTRLVVMTNNYSYTHEGGIHVLNSRTTSTLLSQSNQLKPVKHHCKLTFVSVGKVWSVT